MGSVTIAGEVRGGSGSGSASILSDQSMGAIAVGTNWTAASIAAGVKRGADGQFGTDDDTGRVARISSITIGGAVAGTAGGTDHFAFTAAQVVKLSEQGAKVALKEGASLDGEGGFTVWGKLIPARRSLDTSALPIGLAKDIRLTANVAKGEIVRMPDVALGAATEAMKLRREAEAMAHPC